jgi:hypothetical protein
VPFRRSGLKNSNWPWKVTAETDEHEAFIRDSCSTRTPCRRSGLSVSGRQSTAAETHENDAVTLSMLDLLRLSPCLVLRFRLRRGVGQFRAGLTERPVSPRADVLAGPAKKCLGNKRTLCALLIRCEHVKYWRENNAKFREEVEPGRLVSPIRLVRVGQSKQGRRNARARRNNPSL